MASLRPVAHLLAAVLASVLPRLRIRQQHCTGYSSGLSNGGGGDLGIDVAESGGVWSFTPNSTVAVTNDDFNTHMHLLVDALPTAYRAALALGCSVRVVIGSLTSGSAATLMPGVCLTDSGGSPASGPVVGAMYEAPNGTTLSVYAGKGNNKSAAANNTIANTDYLSLLMPCHKQAYPVATVDIIGTSGNSTEYVNQAGNATDPSSVSLCITCGTANALQRTDVMSYTLDIEVASPFNSSAPA